MELSNLGSMSSSVNVSPSATWTSVKSCIRVFCLLEAPHCFRDFKTAWLQKCSVSHQSRFEPRSWHPTNECFLCGLGVLFLVLSLRSVKCGSVLMNTTILGLLLCIASVSNG